MANVKALHKYFRLSNTFLNVIDIFFCVSCADIFVVFNMRFNYLNYTDVNFFFISLLQKHLK